MDYYERSFRTYLEIIGLLENRKINLRGGVIERVRVGDHNIEYKLNIKPSGRGKKKTLDMTATATGKANDKQPCFIMKIIPGGASSLTSLSRGITCFLDNKDDSSGLLLAGLEIARLKGAKTFEFTDNSVKVVDGKKIRLSDLSFLTTGKTWYERILPNIKMVDEVERRSLEIRRKTVKENKWIDVYNNLLNNNIIVSFDTSGIDINKTGSAMKVLDRAKKSKKYADFFHNEMETLIISSRVIPVRGSHWVMDI
jgi:hypothetical protein